MTLRALTKPPLVHVEKEFLDPDDHAQMLASSLAGEADYKASSVSVYEDGEVIEGRVNPETRVAGSRRLEKHLSKVIQRAVFAHSERIERAIGVPFPVGPAWEIEAVQSGDGAFFTPHIDTIRGQRSSHRVISAVYYYARQPKGFSGGELRLWSLDRSSSVTVEPVDNSMVFFSSMFFHEVLPVSVPSRAFEDSRFSVNCWIHRRS